MGERRESEKVEKQYLPYLLEVNSKRILENNNGRVSYHYKLSFERGNKTRVEGITEQMGW